MALPEVQIELYEHGKGPRYTFKTKLQGWEANRLDLESIQKTYGLEAVYAYSITTGRGQRLVLHPRNGLSLVCYSGKPGVIIRLDSDPKTPVRRIVLRFAVGGLLIALVLLCIFSDYRPLWFYKLQALVGGGIGWIIALSILIFSQLAGWPFRRKARPRRINH